MPLNNESHLEIIAKSAGVIEELTPEIYDYVISLLPTPAAHSELHERFEASFASSLKGDPEKVKECEADRKAMNQNLAVLNALIKAAAIKDPSLPEKIGLGRTAERTAIPAGALGHPEGFRINFDKMGQPYASLTKLLGAKAYELWACDGDPSAEANWRLLESSTKCQRIAIMGLNRAKLNWLKIRGKRSNSVGPWSNCISLNPA